MHNICRAGGKIRSSVSRFSYQLRTLRVEVSEMKRLGEGSAQWDSESTAPIFFKSPKPECSKNITLLFHNVILAINHDWLSTHVRCDKGQDDKVTLIERVLCTAINLVTRSVGNFRVYFGVINYSPAQTWSRLKTEVGYHFNVSSNSAVIETTAALYGINVRAKYAATNWIIE